MATFLLDVSSLQFCLKRGVDKGDKKTLAQSRGESFAHAVPPDLLHVWSIS